MAQLVELNKKADKFEAAGAEVIAIFREEQKGVEGLKTIKDKTKTEFKLALDNGNKQTARYNPEKMNFSSYVLDKNGVVKEIIKGDLRNRAKSDQLLNAIGSLSKSEDGSSGKNKEGSTEKSDGENR